MPEFDVLLDNDDTPLFPADDPLTFTMPDPEDGALHVYHAVDRSIFPDDRTVNFGNQPRAAMVEIMVANAVDEEQTQLRKQLHELLNEGLVTIEKLTELTDWLNDQREKARKRLAKRKLHRPTGGQSPSLPSSSTGRATSEDAYS